MHSLLEENGIVKGVQYKSEAGQELTAYAPLTVVCDGCNSNLRRSLCNPKVRTTAILVRNMMSLYCKDQDKTHLAIFYFLHDAQCISRNENLNLSSVGSSCSLCT